MFRELNELIEYDQRQQQLSELRMIRRGMGIPDPPKAKPKSGKGWIILLIVGIVTCLAWCLGLLGI